MNKFMKKIMSKKDGFTLVELIVVIAILAILAGVAVPAYSGYIKKANDAADTSALGAVKTAAQAVCATLGEVTKIEVKTDSSYVVTDIVITYKNAAGASQSLTAYDHDKTPASGGAAAVPGWDADFGTYMNNTVPTLKGSYTVGAEWTSTGWVAKDI